MFTIVTQDMEAVNYSAIRRISIIRTVVENIETGEESEMLALTASLLEEENKNEPLVLGYYPTEEKAVEVFRAFIDCLNTNIDKVFTMPELSE